MNLSYSGIKNSLFIVCSAIICFISGCSKGGSNTPSPKSSSPTVTITSLGNTEGSYNTLVIINGTGFDPDFNNDAVTFNGKPAAIEMASSTKIYAYVPLAAGTGNVKVSVSGVNVTGPVFTYTPALVVTTFAGDLLQYGNVNATGSAARFQRLSGIAIDKSGNLYVADQGNLVIRKITPQGVVTTFAGSGKSGRTDGTVLTATFESPTGIAVDQLGNLFVTDGGVLREITTAGNVSTVSLNLTGALSVLRLNAVGIAIDASNNIYIADGADKLIAKIATNGTVTEIAGNSVYFLNFVNPIGVTIDKTGSVFIADNNVVWDVVPPGNAISQFASIGPNGQQFNAPQGITNDGQGNVYVADTGNLCIKKITANGTVSLVAGVPGEGPEITNGLVSTASFTLPTGVVIDATGNIFVADGNAIREISVQ